HEEGHRFALPGDGGADLLDHPRGGREDLRPAQDARTGRREAAAEGAGHRSDQREADRDQGRPLRPVHHRRHHERLPPGDREGRGDHRDHRRREAGGEACEGTGQEEGAGQAHHHAEEEHHDEEVIAPEHRRPPLMTRRPHPSWRRPPRSVGGGPCGGYFTDPAASPPMMRRWKISTMMISGTVTITPAAIFVPYGVSNCEMPVNFEIATFAVCISGAFTIVRAMRNSFQAAMKVMIAVVNTPGAASGRITRRNAPNRVVPSTIAACSSSTGSCRKNALR